MFNLTVCEIDIVDFIFYFILFYHLHKGCLPNKKRKKIQTIVKKVGGGNPQTQNKNWKLILDKSIRREGAKSVCQNFKND